MKDHKNVLLKDHPIIWLKIKYLDGLNKSDLALVSMFPFLAIVGLLADLVSLKTITDENIAIVLAYMLFVYGLLNIWFVRALITTYSRVQNEKTFYKVLHKDIIEELRQYRAYRAYQNANDYQISLDTIKQTITKILTSFNNNYIKKKYSSAVIATVKYKLNNKLYPIRVGDDANRRDDSIEEEKNSYVYQALNEVGRILPYIYIKDLDKLDAYETGVMGRFTDKIKGRAGSNYKTFIALPIRGGKWPEMEVDVRANLGILGFDMKEKYGFKNFEESELDYMACLADSLSELIEELISVSEKQLLPN